MSPNSKKNDIENGERRDSDIRPKRRDDLPGMRKGLNMDEALTKTNFGTFNYILIIVTALILYAAMVETCGMGYILPVSHCDLNLTSGQKGVLASIPFAGIICAAYLWGFVADRHGRRSVIQPTLFATFLFTTASSFAQNFYLFATLRFFSGFFISGASATIYAYLSEFHNDAHRSRAIMGSTILFAVFSNLLPLVVWGIVDEEWQFDVPIVNVTYKPWRLFLVACSLPGLVSFFIISFLPESPKFVLGQGRKADAYIILQKVHRINNGKDSRLGVFDICEEAESIENRQRIAETKNSRFPFLSTIWIQTAPLFMPPYLLPTILICTIQFFISATSNGLYMFFAEILNKMANKMFYPTGERVMMCDVISSRPIHYNQTAVLNTEEVCATKLELETLEQSFMLEISYTICLILIGLLVNRVGKFYLLFTNLLVTGICGIICVLTGVVILQKSMFIVLMLSCVATSLVSAATVEVYPTALRGMAVCIPTIFNRLGGMVGANVAGIFLDNHCETVFYTAGTTLIVAGILSYFIPKIHEKGEKIKNAPFEPRASILSIR